MIEEFLLAILSEGFLGLAVLFRRSLPDKLKTPRFIGLLSAVLCVLAWTTACIIQHPIAEIAFGVAGLILFFVFFVAAWWCGASIER